MQDFNNKKGAVVVEAATVFPLVILSVVILIFMMTYFYEQLDERIDMHIALRASSGKLCENVFYKNPVRDDIVTYEKSQQVYSISDVSSTYNMLLNKRRKEIAARKYLIDESEFVRRTHAVKDGLTADE